MRGRHKRWRWLGGAALAAALAGCSSEAPPASSTERPRAEAPVTPTAPVPTPSSPEPTPAPPPPTPEQPPPATVGFQPGFHQALRFSLPADAVATFRLKVPLQRAGSRVRLTFASGDGALRLYRASVAKLGPDGAPLAAPTPLRFAAGAGFETTARTRVTSEPVELAVGAGDTLAVTFEVKGQLAASSIDALPGGELRAGAYGDRPGALAGNPFDRAAGLATVDVEGPLGRAFVALGDSITEGYVDGTDDTRAAWPSVASRLLGAPVVNAGVSGQGVFSALEHLEREVLPLQGVTDCVVFVGTNDLGGRTAELITGGLDQVVQKLEPLCRVWLATLLPKDRTSNGTLSEVLARREAVNAWIRARPGLAGVVEFAPVLARPGDAARLADGVHSDGIHPNEVGQQKLGEAAAKALGGAQ